MTYVHCKLLSRVALFGAIALAFNSNAESEDKNKKLFSLNLEQLLNVKVTSASKTSQKVSIAPSIISVITADEINRMGAVSLIDVLNIIPGFTPLKQLKSDRVMVVRGLALKDGVLVLIDGVPVNDAFDGSFDYYERTVNDLERIEVIRGPGSALYGGYAVSAVVHFFTSKTKTNSNAYQVSVSSGSFDEKRFSLKANKDLSSLRNGLKMSASFSYFDNQGDKLEIIQDSIFRPSQAEFLAPLVSPTLTPTTRQEAKEKFNGHFKFDFNSLQISFNHNQIISTPLVSHLGIVTEEGKSIKESTLDMLSAHYQWKPSDSLDVKSKIYWVNNESKLFGQSQPPQIHGDEDQDGLNEDFASGIIENFRHKTETVGAEIELGYQASEQHNFLFGLVLDQTELTETEKFANVSLLSRGPSAIFPAQDLTSQFVPSGVKRDHTALYLQNFWQINSKANLTTGLRYGDYSDFGTTLNPRLGLTYQINDSFYSKILYGEAFKPPGFSQLFDATPTLSSSRQRGNIELQPTEIKTFEVQLGYETTSSLQTTLTVFKNDTSNEIFFDPQPGVQQWQNSGQRQSQGAEFEVRGAMLGLDYSYLNYSYQKVKGVDRGAGANTHPPHRINFGGSQQISDNLIAGFTYSYFSSPKRDEIDPRNRVEQKSLLSFNMHATDFITQDLDLKLSVSNLLDEDGRDEVEGGVRLLDDIPIEGRSFRLTLSYDF